MMKGKLSRSKIYFEGCSCGTTLACSSASTLTNARLLRKYTTVNNETRTASRNFTKSVPNGNWKSDTNARKFLDDLGKKLDIKNPDDWYEKISKKVFLQNGGSSLLSVHKNSPITALMAAYPEHNWLPWKFNVVNRGYWDSTSSQKKFFDNLALKLGVHSLDDWYQKLSWDNIVENGGVGLLAKYKGSPMATLMAVYPEHNWHPWKFRNVPRSHWAEQSNVRKFFDDLGKQLGVQTLDDWYQKLSKQACTQNGGRGFLAVHQHSPIAALKAAYPEHNWDSYKFKHATQGYWSIPQNQRKFMDDLGSKLGVAEMDDWYQKLTHEVLIENGGAGLLTKQKNSRMAVLMAAYPEHNWDPLKFRNGQPGYWNNVENQRKFFDDLAKEIGVEKMVDWYQKLSALAISKHGGASLLAQHKGSPLSALMAAYPEHNWIPWKFNNVPRSFWKEQSNVRKFFDALGKQLGIQNLDDWYQKSSRDVIAANGGGGLLVLHEGSPLKALMAAYPEHNWIPWKFNSVSKGTWNSTHNINAFLSELSEKLSIQTLDDWYRVDLKQLQLFGAASIVSKYKGLYNLLKEQYPHHPWDRKKFQQGGGRKGQRWLAVTLKNMFPNEEILEDYMHPDVVFPSSKRPMQLDVFIPSRSLAFEYQGIQHFEEVGVFGPSKTYQQRDEEKRILCAGNNIKLIEVPYWWNRTQKSLQEMITKA